MVKVLSACSYGSKCYRGTASRDFASLILADNAFVIVEPIHGNVYEPPVIKYGHLNVWMPYSII